MSPAGECEDYSVCGDHGAMVYSVYIAHNSGDGDMSPLTPHSPTQRWADALVGVLDPYPKYDFSFMYSGGQKLVRDAIKKTFHVRKSAQPKGWSSKFFFLNVWEKLYL